MTRSIDPIHGSDALAVYRGNVIPLEPDCCLDRHDLPLGVEAAERVTRCSGALDGRVSRRALFPVGPVRIFPVPGVMPRRQADNHTGNIGVGRIKIPVDVRLGVRSVDTAGSSKLKSGGCRDVEYTREPRHPAGPNDDATIVLPT